MLSNFRNLRFLNMFIVSGFELNVKSSSNDNNNSKSKIISRVTYCDNSMQTSKVF